MAGDAEKVHLAVNRNDDLTFANREAANGFYLLRSLYGMLGADDFWSAVKLYRTSNRWADPVVRARVIATVAS